MPNGSHDSRSEPEAASSTSPTLRAPLTQADRDFVGELFERHRLSLYRYLHGLLRSREEASDVLQETYLRLLRQPTFEPIRANARAYLFQTATNLARDLFRHRAVRRIDAERQAHPIDGSSAQDWASSPDLVIEGDQLAAAILDALKTMNPCIREALLLYRLRDMTHRDIAIRMGVSTRTVERYVKEALTYIDRRITAVYEK
jgi:RNA polymerase sigma factor (sigma-70 family)